MLSDDIEKSVVHFFKKNAKKQVWARQWWCTSFNPSTQEAKRGGFLSLRPACSTEQVPEQAGLYSGTLSKK